MSDQDILETIVVPALRDASATIPGLDFERPSPNLSLYGTNEAVLDSLNLVSFVFIVEETVKKVLGKDIKITAQDLLGREINPFSRLSELAKFLRSKIEEG